MECQHEYVAGCLHVADEDIDLVAMMRIVAGQSLPECVKCEQVYMPAGVVFLAVELSNDDTVELHHL